MSSPQMMRMLGWLVAIVGLLPLVLIDLLHLTSWQRFGDCRRKQSQSYGLRAALRRRVDRAVGSDRGPRNDFPMQCGRASYARIAGLMDSRPVRLRAVEQCCRPMNLLLTAATTRAIWWSSGQKPEPC